MKASERHLSKVTERTCNNGYDNGDGYRQTVKNTITGKSITTYYYNDTGMEYIESIADYNLFCCMSNDTYTLRSYYPGKYGSTLGKLKSVEYFNDNKLSGKQIYYYESGKIKMELNYKNNLLDGKQFFYYDKTKEGIICKLGKDNIYGPISIKRQMVVYDNGNKLEEIEYDENEEIIREALFSNDVIIKEKVTTIKNL